MFQREEGDFMPQHHKTLKQHQKGILKKSECNLQNLSHTTSEKTENNNFLDGMEETKK